MSDNTPEKDFVLPALFYMSLTPAGYITTSELIAKLEAVFKPSGNDAAILAGRTDSHFSQKVRNLKSHKTFSRLGYGREVQDGFSITPQGRAFVKRNIPLLQYLLNNSFSDSDLSSVFSISVTQPNRHIIPYNELVTEGSIVVKATKSYERSSMLRKAAIEHYTKNGVIECKCCGFIFEDKYPQEYKCNCIEIHHMHPIYQYEGEAQQQTIENALKNLMPVCPNCHRVIHKNNIAAAEIEAFSKKLRATL